MITNEQASRIASAALSAPFTQMLTLVPHDEGRFEEDGRPYAWHSLHLLQAQLFVIVRRQVPKGPLEYVSFQSVFELARVSASLKNPDAKQLAWHPLD